MRGLIHFTENKLAANSSSDKSHFESVLSAILSFCPEEKFNKCDIFF